MAALSAFELDFFIAVPSQTRVRSSLLYIFYLCPMRGHRMEE